MTAALSGVDRPSRRCPGFWISARFNPAFLPAQFDQMLMRLHSAAIMTIVQMFGLFLLRLWEKVDRRAAPRRMSVPEGMRSGFEQPTSSAASSWSTLHPAELCSSTFSHNKGRRLGAALPEFARPRETLRHHAAGCGAGADPFGQLLARLGEGTVGRILPGQAGLQRERLQVQHAAVLVFLQAHALAARHFRDFGEREDQHLAILADDGEMVAGGRNA